MSARDSSATIELALVSHTNAGKTTLARTLLGRDVGEVRDAPHVTDVAQAHLLLETPAGDVLRALDHFGVLPELPVYAHRAAAHRDA